VSAGTRKPGNLITIYILPLALFLLVHVQLGVITVRSRILSQLELLASRTPAGGPAVIPLSQSELASLIGSTRETTSTTLNALAREGLVTLGHRQVLLNANVQAAKTMTAGNGTV
jgi:CRP-like cAMP-binding protein